MHRFDKSPNCQIIQSDLLFSSTCIATAIVKALSIEHSSSRENSYVKSLKGESSDELLHEEVFTALTDDRVLIEQWKMKYNQVRPHTPLGYRPTAPEAKMSVTLA